MELTRRPLGDRAVVEVSFARLDAAVAHEFKNRLTGMIDRGDREIVLDLGRVEFIDSSGLGAVVGVLKHMGGRGRIELARLNPAVRKVFALTRMTGVFTIHDEVPAT